MEEKIKIYIPESVNNILLKDMERFEFFKKDGSLNRNEFYNTLILNYYEQYEESQGEIFSHIQEVIRENTSLKSSVVSDGLFFVRYNHISLLSPKISSSDIPTYGLDSGRNLNLSSIIRATSVGLENFKRLRLVSNHTSL